ncbi:MAG: hypothetical protein ABGF52_08945 [Candidatus Asgardarchaeum sp.]
MVSFEKFFHIMKKILNKEIHDPWPLFERLDSKSKDYAYIEKMEHLGRVLLVNCGDCDGPSYIGHKTCLLCIKDILQEINLDGKKNPDYIILSRIIPTSSIKIFIKEHK